ncbi:MAG: hypothetical protein ACYCQK_01480 [Acidiferrobacteraceae bacterium]
MSILQAPAAPQPMFPPAMPQPNPDRVAAIAAQQLLSDEEFSKLKERVSKSYANLQPQRRKRLQTLKQYVGNSLGTNVTGSSIHSCVVNLLDQMVEVYMQKLISGNPQCLVLTDKIGLRAGTYAFQMALNHVLTKINLRDSIKMGVLESLFSMLILKVGVENPEFSDRNYPFDVSAIPFVDAIWFEDWVHDTTVTRLQECRFMGDKYRESRDNILRDPRNDPEVAKSCMNGPMTAFDQGGDIESASQLGGNDQSAFEAENEQEEVWLWDIYIPRKKIIVTFPVNAIDKPLRVVKWTGHPEGPYRIGRYKLVLNQIMPKPPAVDIAPLADLDNRLMEKLGEQASRQKVIGLATMAAGKDAEAVIRASDGQVINVTHPEAVRQMSFGGVDQGNMAFEQVVKARASFEAGNLETMGGLSPGADTLGQEQMLQQSSSGRLQMMQQVIVEVTKSCIIAVGWYLWNDPLVRISVTDKIPNTDIELEIQWPKQPDLFGKEQDLRQGEFNDLNFDIVPYSLTDKPPGQRLQIMNGVVQQLLPILPMLQQQGIQFDAQAWIERIEQYTGLEELSEILKTSGPLPQEQQGVNLGVPKPAATTRQYDRVVRPQGGQDSAAEIVSNMGSTNQGGVK